MSPHRFPFSRAPDRADHLTGGPARRWVPAPLAGEGGLAHPPPVPPGVPPRLLAPDADLPPGGPLSDEPPMETDRHLVQLRLLLECAEWGLRDRPDIYITGNMTIFFNPEQLKRQDFRGPDFFVVVGTDRRPRNSWVVWEEGGRFPDVIIELLSKKTRDNDLGLKKQIYQDVFRTPEYYAFDPEKAELFAFALVDGYYEPRSPDARGLLWSDGLGHFLGVRGGQLRLFAREGEAVPTGVERGLMAEAAQQRAEQEARRADDEARRADDEARRADEMEQRAKRLAEQLRALGLEPGAPIEGHV